MSRGTTSNLSQFDQGIPESCSLDSLDIENESYLEGWLVFYYPKIEVLTLFSRSELSSRIQSVSSYLEGRNDIFFKYPYRLERRV